MKPTVVFFSFCALFVTKVECQQNLAKFKPAWQSTNYSVGEGFASNGNDGNRNSIYWRGESCTATGNSNGPWWIVDLGAQYKIAQIILVNRVDCCSSRLRDFTVAVAASMTSLTDLSQFKRCYHYPGTAGAGEILDLDCYPQYTGRYVKVQLLGYGILTLCEAEAYGVEVTCQKTGLFHEIANTTTDTAVRTISVSGGGKQCAVYCMELNYCKSFNLKRVSDDSYECEIADDTASLQMKIGWSHFSSCNL